MIAILIEESWAKILENNTIYVEKHRRDLLPNVSFPEKAPLFINDFSGAINLLKKNKKFKLIHKSLLQYVYQKNYLKNNFCVLYYCSNNRLIIEFQKGNEDKALLILNPLNNNIKDSIYIIPKNKEIYQQILGEILSIEYSEYKKYLTSFTKYINSSSNVNNNIFQNNNENTSLRNLIKFFIYIIMNNIYYILNVMLFLKSNII